MTDNKKSKSNFDIIFQKLSEMEEPNGKVSELVNESEAINKLREIVLEVNEENERYFSTA